MTSIERTSRAARLVLLASVLLASATGCKREAPSESGGAPSAAPSAPGASAHQAAPAPSAKPHRAGYPLGNTTTIGYPLEILPGKGLGPIRFGAKVETVERHMTRPCDIRTETRCLYIDQAVDFTLKDGVVSEMYVVRRDRPAPPKADGSARYFGTFLGGMTGGFALGLHRHVVDQELRAPDRVEELKTPNENGTVARYYYDGLVLDFDQLENGSTVVGAARIVPSPTGTNPVKVAAAPSAAPGAPKAPPAPPKAP